MSSEERAVRQGRLQVLADARALAARAAEVFAAASAAACAARGRFTVALSGGATPRALHQVLADGANQPAGPRVDWARAHVFWSDERHVPPDHPDSNYRMARETLLSRVAIPQERIHRILGEDADAERAAALYESDLRACLPGPPPGGAPRLDLVLLGLGPDGHTASLFPGSPALRETTRLVAAPFVEKLGVRRITMTPPMLNAADQVVFLVAGREKATALRDALEAEGGSDLYPACWVNPAGGALLWLADAAAASLLKA